MSIGVPAQQLPDEELVRGFLTTRDDSFFLELFERYRRRVYGACRNFFQDAGEAEDATQEVFLRVFHNLDRFGGGDFVGWIMRIARNVCIDQWRRCRREVGLEQIADVLPAPGPSLERSVALRIAARQLRQEMIQLPANQRRCLDLMIEGRSYDEIAALTSSTLKAVKSHIQNGRRMLWIRMRHALSDLQ
jgi:RNA polymerase sigma-70 factor (ECF subfamily)